MAYTVTQLITDAYYTSGIVGREFETISGSQLNDGLGFLNSLLSKKTADQGGIPYFLEYNSVMVQGQEQYFIPGLISVDSLTFFINDTQGNSVRYGCRKVDRKLYWGSPRANNIQSLPFNYTVERQFGGASVYFYFLPNQAFPFQIWGLFSLNQVTLNQDLSLTLDLFYIDFLKFELANRLCAEFNYVIPPGAKLQLDEYQLIIDSRQQRMDLTQQTISALAQAGEGLNYAYANLGTGWSVP